MENMNEPQNVENPIQRIINYGWDEVFSEEDIINRRLYLNESVDECVLDNAAYHIMRYNRMDKGIPKEDRKPIILYLNTPGGSVVDGYGLIDAILTSETPVYTVNMAQCASMGFLIFIAGSKRYAMPHSEFLMHDGSTFTWDSTAKAKDRMEFETVQLEKMTKNYIISHTKINEKLYDEKYRVEWYFLVDEAKEVGVADYIVGKDCSIDDIL